jgi:uncharacterized protein (DUF58 family)
LLGKAWIVITVFLFILAVALKQPALLVVTLLFFMASGLARLWSAYAFKRLEYGLEISERRVFFGEQINLEITLTNGKFLPLPWVHLEVEIPTEVKLLKGKTYSSAKPGREALSGFFSLGWYHRIKRRYPVLCGRRGIFFFGPSRINTGDPFGFFRNASDFNEEATLLVFPRILTLTELGIPSRQPFGDIRLRRHLFEDPIQVMAIRDYVPGDPMKRIHWKATARLQKLQSRVFDHTTSMDMALFLDSRTVSYQYYWFTLISDLLETAILTATAIADHSLRNGYKVGVYANEYYWNTNHLLKLAPSDHQNQMKGILEAMAQIRGLPVMTIDNLIRQEARQISWQTTLVVITAVLTDETATVLEHFRKAGRRIALVLIGTESSDAGLEGITIYRVSEEVYRKQEAEFNLEQIR